MRSEESGAARGNCGGTRSVPELDERPRGAAGAFETIEVGLHETVVAERAECGGKDGGDAGVRRLCDAVVHPFAFTAGGDDAGAAKVSEVA